MVLKDDIFFIETKIVRFENMELCSCFEFRLQNPKHEAQREDPCENAYKNYVSLN